MREDHRCMSALIVFWGVVSGYVSDIPIWSLTVLDLTYSSVSQSFLSILFGLFALQEISMIWPWNLYFPKNIIVPWWFWCIDILPFSSSHCDMSFFDISGSCSTASENSFSIFMTSPQAWNACITFHERFLSFPCPFLKNSANFLESWSIFWT